jgi:hypothetical protein
MDMDLTRKLTFRFRIYLSRAGLNIILMEILKAMVGLMDWGCLNMGMIIFRKY